MDLTTLVAKDNIAKNSGEAQYDKKVCQRLLQSPHVYEEAEQLLR